MKIGKNIKYFRNQMGYSQKELAELIFVGERTIGHYETETRIPPIDKLELIADALDVELEDLKKRNKKDMDDWEEYFFFGGKGSKKNMDERRFRMIMKRVYYVKDDEFDENGDIIKADGNRYSKSLAEEILMLTNDMMNVHELWYCPPMGWLIRGHLHENSFEISIKKEDSCWIMDATDPYDKERRMSLEIKQIVEITKSWFKREYPGEQLEFTLGTCLYLENLTNEELLNREIFEFDFEKRIFNGLKREGRCKTVQDLINITEKELQSINSLGFSSILVVQRIQDKITKWLIDKAYHVFCVPKPTLKEMYPNAEEIPVDKTGLEFEIALALKRAEIDTLGDVCNLSEEILLMAIYGIDEEEVEEIKDVLTEFGLTLKK